MVFKTYKNAIFPFILGRYLQLEGLWSIGSSSNIYHDSLLDAKRACLKNPMCFGFSADVCHGKVYSNAFPVYMKSGGDFNLRQKQTLLGILVLKERYKI